MIEKAPISKYLGLANALEAQRDADHQYYTEGEGRKEIHKEEVKAFAKWLNKHYVGLTGQHSTIKIFHIYAAETALLKEVGEKEEEK